MITLKHGKVCIETNELDHLIPHILKGSSASSMITTNKLFLQEANVAITNYAMSMDGSFHLMTDAIDCAINKKEKFKLINIEALILSLGGRFDDLIKQEIIYLPTDRMKELARTGQYKNEVLREITFGITYKGK